MYDGLGVSRSWGVGKISSQCIAWLSQQLRTFSEDEREFISSTWDCDDVHKVAKKGKDKEQLTVPMEDTWVFLSLWKRLRFLEIHKPAYNETCSQL